MSISFHALAIRSITCKEQTLIEEYWILEYQKDQKSYGEVAYVKEMEINQELSRFELFVKRFEQRDRSLFIELDESTMIESYRKILMEIDLDNGETISASINNMWMNEVKSSYPAKFICNIKY